MRKKSKENMRVWIQTLMGGEVVARCQHNGEGEVFEGEMRLIRMTDK